MVCSVTEGEDKPLKYPLMFRACELVVVNKIDLLPHLDFDLDRLLANVDAVNPGGASDPDQRPHRRGRRRVARVAGRRARARRGAGLIGGTCAWARRRGRARAAGSTSCSPPRSRPTSASSRARPSALARCCHPMAERFARGGRLVAFGRSPGRALGRPPRRGRVRPPGDRRQAGAAGASGSPREGGAARARRLTAVAEPDDIAIAFEADADDREPARRSRLARERGCLTIAFGPAGAEWEFVPGAEDPFVAPGAGRDALPRALGAGPRLLRPPRAARGPRGARRPRHRRLELPLSVPRGVRGRPRRGRSPTSASSALAEGGRGRRAARADAGRQPRRRWSRRRRACARCSTPAAGCSPAATAARRPTRWTWSPTFATPPPAGGRRGGRSTSPRTPRSSPRSPTTSASRRSSSAR